MAKAFQPPKSDSNNVVGPIEPDSLLYRVLEMIAGEVAEDLAEVKPSGNESKNRLMQQP